MSKHTPGPWSAKDRDNQIAIPLKSIDCERIGFSVCFVNGHRENEAKANARLIAAAPELLEALQRLSAQCERMRMLGQSQSNAERNAAAVLAKATGEPQ